MALYRLWIYPRRSRGTDQCPMCKVGKEKFVEVEEKAGGLDFVTEHKLGDGKGASQELWEGLNNHFMGECSEVGQYLAMARQADREGYPEIAEAFKRYAWEEAEHASKFAELIGDIVWDTKTNLFKRMNAECGACEDKDASGASGQGAEPGRRARYRTRDGQGRSSSWIWFPGSLQSLFQGVIWR